jgi:predicted RNase H-like HicB family nuclease
MGNRLFKKADETTDGKEIYLASHPELFGCMAQGVTIEEAQENLKEATIEYIESLLEDGLDIPQPRIEETITSTGSTSSALIEGSLSSEGEFVEVLCEVAEKDNRQLLGSFTPMPA